MMSREFGITGEMFAKSPLLRHAIRRMMNTMTRLNFFNLLQLILPHAFRCTNRPVVIVIIIIILGLNGWDVNIKVLCSRTDISTPFNPQLFIKIGRGDIIRSTL
jgi:hypothetical protein